jgi:hypothetical protein
MKTVKFTISCIVPVPAASLLGGNNANKGLSKVDRENRYFLNALIRRGAILVSQEDVATSTTPAPAAKVGK